MRLTQVSRLDVNINRWLLSNLFFKICVYNFSPTVITLRNSVHVHLFEMGFRHIKNIIHVQHSASNSLPSCTVCSRDVSLFPKRIYRFYFHFRTLFLEFRSIAIFHIVIRLKYHVCMGRPWIDLELYYVQIY